jgi:hypothetical protein
MIFVNVWNAWGEECRKCEVVDRSPWRQNPQLNAKLADTDNPRSRKITGPLRRLADLKSGTARLGKRWPALPRLQEVP